MSRKRFTDLENLDLIKFAYGGLILDPSQFLLLHLEMMFASKETRKKSPGFVSLDMRHTSKYIRVHTDNEAAYVPTSGTLCILWRKLWSSGRVLGSR